MSCRTRLVVAYLGGPFAGWQRQPVDATVQGELEAALRAITGGLDLSVTGASRTDAGVHAAAQVAHLDPPEQLPPAALVRALNAVLPSAIRVRRADRVRPSFHARHHALGKHYCYRVRWSPPTLPWLALRSARVRRPVTRLAAVVEAVAALPGRRDWASFTVPDHGQPSSVRTLSRAWCQEAAGGLDLHFVGDGFLRYQVRRLVGTLLLVGWGRLVPADVGALLAEPAPGAGILTAAAEGLTLEHVYYRSTPLLVPPATDGEARAVLDSPTCSRLDSQPGSLFDDQP